MYTSVLLSNTDDYIKQQIQNQVRNSTD